METVPLLSGRTSRPRRNCTDASGTIDKLKEIDTSGVEPLDHPTELLNRDRDDEVGVTLSQQQVLDNAPAVRDVYIDVPKVLGESS